MLHLCLEGCRGGVEITVGGVTVSNTEDDDDGDGGKEAAIIFDDSFVFTMYNRGVQDAVFLQVVLSHPRSIKTKNSQC
jgi:hypothetical protein